MENEEKVVQGTIELNGLTMSHGGNIPALFSAFSKFQGELAVQEIRKNKEVKVKTRDGGTYTFRYADLDALHSVADPILAKYELSVAQPILPDGSLMTILAHSSGQFLASCFKIMPKHESGPQDIGSALTYTRRYTYALLLWVVSEDDDDGNRASGNEYQLGNSDGSEPDAVVNVNEYLCAILASNSLEELKAVWGTVWEHKWTPKETKQLDAAKDQMKTKLTPTDEKKANIADKFQKKTPEPVADGEAKPEPKEELTEDEKDAEILGWKESK